MALLLLVLYCVVFSFVGISYRRPHGVSRVGVCAVGVCAVVVGQCIFARDGHLVSALQHFSFMHRLVGPFIFGMTWVHTLLWSVELGFVYQPQPEKVCVDVEEAILGRGSDGAAHVLVLVFF